MHYHSASRPRWAGQGAFGKIIAPSGACLGALPSLYLDPLEDGTWECMVQLQVAVGAFRQYTSRLSYDELLAILHDWRRDPEAVLRDTFKYDFAPWATNPPRAAPQARSGTTLEDLGL
jgi:hypothetical protein